MKYAKLCLSLIIVAALLVSLWVPTTNQMTSNELIHEVSSKSVFSYVPHSEIYIVNDTDLADQPGNEGWPGDGLSAETPFLIQGYEFYDENTLIVIRNTTLHFKILDCNITDAIFGIWLVNVTNGVIENCLFVDTEWGINLDNVTGIDVIGCDITVHSSLGNFGIYIREGIDCYIGSCVIQGTVDSEAGIYGQYLEGIELFNNTIFDFDNHGISLFRNYDMSILNNTLYWNEGSSGGEPCGIDIWQCDLAYISGNNITENSESGISLIDSGNVTIIENHIVDNLMHGVNVEYSGDCIIQNNFIAGNGEGIIEDFTGGISGYSSDYIQIIGNEFLYNTINSITLYFSDFGYISNNLFNHSYNHGMYLYDSDNVTIEENEVHNSYGIGSGPACGIFLDASGYTSVINNILGNNSENGITIIEGTGAGEIIGNTIYDSEYSGLYMEMSFGWSISYNVIYDNDGPGIVLDDPTSSNLLYYNDIGWSGEFLVSDNGFADDWNYTIIGNWYSDYTGTGTYTIPGSPGAVDHYPSMSLYSGVTEPSEYELGTTGNTMTWNSSALNPGTYELLIDSVPQGPEFWDGGAITADVDGLAIGVYNVTLVTYHVSGHWLWDQSTLTVVDTEGPTWTATPTDQVLEYNVVLSYQLEASDPSGIASWAVNDTTSFAISASGLLTNATNLTPGVYYVEITVTDAFSHSTTATIMITVNTVTLPPSDPTGLVLAIGGIGAVAVIILVVFVLKKKGT